ncbi:hypothetical protein DID76_02000 [Candidatus Marinamargulisbacteria bacterium SCGC AG-414-C22]|nr:hypothetical protein DID76_02000 [Candidatus Marinamargulisbacteria bacterium SCGC AG-414-C22]
MNNIKSTPVSHISYFRKLAIGTWSHPNDPTYYGKIHLDLKHIKPFLENLNKNTQLNVSINHVAAKIMSLVFAKYPYLNTVLIRNKPRQRTSVSTFFQTHLRHKDGYDLLGININDSNLKSLAAIASEVADKTKKLRLKKDKPMERAKRLIGFVPVRLMTLLVAVFDFILYTLNIKCLGLPDDKYGSFGLTSVGSLGIDEAYVPLFPFSRCGMMIAVGKERQDVGISHNNVVIKDIVTLTFTCDHRYFDGAHLAKPLRFIRKIEQHPEKFLT